MSAHTGIRDIREHLRSLSSASDEALEKKYRLTSPLVPPGYYWKARWLVGWLLRLLENLHLKRPAPWPARLRQATGNRRARPLLVWAVGAEPERLRAACERIAGIDDLSASYAPVLVTDVADFTFFSRLGWLVEYLPALRGEGEPYNDRKAKLLARLYAGAPVLPADAILDAGWEDLRQWVLGLA